MMLSTFSYDHWSPVYILWRNVCPNPCPFLKGVIFLLLIFKSSLYIWIQVYYRIYDLQMYSPILWALFSLSWWCIFIWWSILLFIILLLVLLASYLRNYCLTLWIFLYNYYLDLKIIYEFSYGRNNLGSN